MNGTGTVALQHRLKAETEVGRISSNQETEAPSLDAVDATPFNENLFLDEDLDGLDDELNELDLDDK